MIRAGVPERVVTQTSGHKTKAVFDRYNIINEDDLHVGAERLARLNEEQKNLIAETEMSYKMVTITGKEKN